GEGSSAPHVGTGRGRGAFRAKTSDDSHMLTRLLAKPEFLSTFGERMENITGGEDVARPNGVIDIWPYVRAVASPDVPEHIVEEQVVERVWRTSDSRYDHVLLPTRTNNVFLALVVDLRDESV